MVAELKQKVRSFVDERNWNQYHSLKNLSMDITIEAAELMELFLWTEGHESPSVLQEKRKDIEHEVADIAFALLNFCNNAGIDLSQAMAEKIELLHAKYPIDKAYGVNKKYTDLT